MRKKLSKKDEQEAVRNNLAQKVSGMTEEESLAAIDSVKELICRKVKQIGDVEEQKKDAMSSYREALNILKEELDEQVFYKLELENRIRVLDAQTKVPVENN